MEVDAVHNENQFRILICFKTVPDLDTVLEEDWEKMEIWKKGAGGRQREGVQRGAGRAVDFSYLRNQLGDWDEAALENGLRLGDQMRLWGREVQVTALTVGEEVREEIVKNLYGVKCDRVILWECSEDLRFCPERTAQRIAFFVKEEGGFDLILTGQQAPVGDSAKVPWAVAYYLGLPALTQVRELSIQDHDVVAVSEAEGWERSYLCRGPMLCALGNARYPYLRVATLREKLAAGRKQVWLRNDKGWVRTGEAEQPELEGWAEIQRAAQPELEEFYRRQEKRRCTMMEGETTKERAGQLYKTLKEAGVL